MFYVYVDWTTESVPRPYYVGQGKKRRLKNLYRNLLHRRIMAKYGHERRVEFETPHREEALAKEIELISHYKTFFHEKGSWGANFTRGGDGTIGHKYVRTYVMTESHRLAISKAVRGPRNEEFRAKAREIASQRAQDQSWIEKMKSVSKKRWENESYRALQKESKSGKTRSEEQCENISRGIREAFSTDKMRCKLSEGAKSRFENPEERDKVRLKMQELWSDPEYRNAHSKPRSPEARENMKRLAQERKAKREAMKTNNQSEESNLE